MVLLNSHQVALKSWSGLTTIFLKLCLIFFGIWAVLFYIIDLGNIYICTYLISPHVSLWYVPRFWRIFVYVSYDFLADRLQSAKVVGKVQYTSPKGQRTCAVVFACRREVSWAMNKTSPIWVKYNDLSATSLGIMVNKGNHPQMALIQVS
jgi:hypothetical protein